MRALMPFLRRYAVIVPMIAAMSLLMVSCESKDSQCNKIIQVANQAVKDARTITNGGQRSDADTMIKAADAMEKAAKDMEAIKVQDEKLKNYQTGFISMYRTTSKATREFVAAFQKKDRSGAEASLKNLQQATSPEKDLVNQINAYCAKK